MGDVIHNFPVVSDIRRHYPDAEIDWVTESAYASLVKLHPGVRAVHPVHMRDLKRGVFRTVNWRALLQDRAALRSAHYDLVIDTQGLVKSALVARWAHAPIAGYARGVAREPWAAWAYQRTFEIGTNQHAVERNRQLVAATMGYTITTPPDYGLAPQGPISMRVSDDRPYVVLLHATSRDNKKWPLSAWQELARRMHETGIAAVLPWGSEQERATSQSIADTVPGASVPQAMTLDEAATLLRGARAVIGVDTGLSHLAVALQRPTIGIYLTTQPALTGLHGADIAVNLGGGSERDPANVSVDAVFAALSPYLARFAPC